MHGQAIVDALDELERWRERERLVAEELRKAQRQVQYYEALVREMKRDVRPPRLDDLLRAF